MATDVGKIQVSKYMTKMNNMLKGKSAPKIIVIVGLIGMLFVLMSEFIQPRSKEAAPDIKQESILTADQYTATLEQRLGDVISSISGVGAVKIMVTIERGAEYVYAQEIKSSVDVTQDIGKDSVQTKQQKESSEGKYILVEDPKGNRQALLTTQIEPKIKGVLIVCEGADDIKVVATVTEAVTTALNITSNRVCVTKLG